MARKNRIISTMEHRIKWLSQWLEMRNYSLRDERKVFLCIIYNTAKAYLVDEAAQEKTLQINYSFTLPFSREKLQKHIFDSVDKRKSRLNYSNQKIKTLLKITDEEYAALDPDKARREKEERFERKIARNERDEEIISLYQHGVAKKEIARRFDISKKTVQRKINEHQERLMISKL